MYSFAFLLAPHERSHGRQNPNLEIIQLYSTTEAKNS